MMEDNLCSSCRAEMKKCVCEDTEGYSSNGAVCPYCGDVDLASESEGHLYNEGMTENECSSCSKVYGCVLYVSYTWTSRKEI